MVITQVSEIIYNSSKGSKFFNREEARDKVLTEKINRLVEKKAALEKYDLTRSLHGADTRLVELEATRDLTQYIVHVDCDAFYAAVEQLDRPELRDVPFAVGQGVLCTCNYVARKFGCRSGMAGFVAKNLCPDLILLPLNFDKYKAKASEVRDIFADYDPRFESASIDEAYLNITSYCKDHDRDPAEVVDEMRRLIHERTHITVSAGIAANARLAKICSNMNKPNGQYILANDRLAIMAFMGSLPTRKVNGIGRVLERELGAIDIKTCGDIYTHRATLLALFGDKTYKFLLRVYLGLGRTNVQPVEEYERKSIGTESTFSEMDDPEKLREQLRATAVELEKDLQKADCRGRTLVLKVKLHTYEVYTRQAVARKVIYHADDIFELGLTMLTKLMAEIPRMRLRLMGLRVTHLVSSKKPDTLSFFGLRSREGSSGGDGISKPLNNGAEVSRVQYGEDGWQKWPSQDPTQDTFKRDYAGSAVTEHGQESQNFQSHGKEITPNPSRNSEPVDEWWDCPICGRPQGAEEKLFNTHIDLCLSRGTIRDVVQENGGPAVLDERQRESSIGARVSIRKGKVEKKRGRPPTTDPKQKRLCFG
jgi:DNA polymerase kappa